MKRQVYVAIANCDGFFIGLANENERGYIPQPQYGSFKSYEAASAEAEKLNIKEFGIGKHLGCMIALSSMFPLSPKKHAERIEEWSDL